MKKTTWWLRIVGAFYLLLTFMNLYGLFVDTSFYSQILPGAMKTDPLAIRAFADAWLVFVFELGVLGVMLLYASRDPARSGILVLTVVGAELFRGAVADAIWIARGYSAAEYIPFIVLHFIIITTGLWFWRQESRAAGIKPVTAAITAAAQS